MKNTEALSDNAEGQVNETEWDSLSKLKFNPKTVSSVEISPAGDKFGEGRDDRDVSVRTSEGSEYKTSSIMFGKKGNGENLENTTYLSSEDIKTQIVDAVSDGKNKSLVDASYEPPRQVTVDEVMSDVAREALEKNDAIRLNEAEVNNANAKRLEVVDSEGNVEGKSFLIFNREAEISDGEYLSEQAVTDALQKYMLAEPKDEAVVSTPEEFSVPGVEMNPGLEPQVEPARGKIIYQPSDRSRNLAKKVITAVVTVAMSLSLVASSAVYAGNGSVSRDNPQNVAETIIDGMDVVKDGVESIDPREIVEQDLLGVSIGDQYNIPNGVEAHLSSDYQHGGEDGAVDLAGGSYDIQSFSTQDPVSHEIMETTWQEGDKLEDFLEKSAQELSQKHGHEVTVQELKDGTKIHVGSTDPNGPQRIGWIDYEDIVNNSIQGGVNE